MNITLYMFIIPTLSSFINPLDFDVVPAEEKIVPIYGALVACLVLVYLTYDVEYLNTYSPITRNLISLIDPLSRFNLFITSFLLLSIIYSHSFSSNFLASVVYLNLLVLVIVLTLVIPVVLFVFSIVTFLQSKYDTHKNHIEATNSFNGISDNLKTALEMLTVAEKNHYNQQIIIHDLKTEIKALYSQLHTKDEQIEKLNENIHKQTTNVLNLTQKEKIKE
jgi:hypothetical protein